MKKVNLVNIIIKISGAPKYIIEIGLATVTKKVVRGVGMREGVGVGVPVFPFSRIPVLRAEVTVIIVVGEDEGELDEVVLGVEEEVETEAREKEIASLSNEMILPGMVAIT